jgi:hypothetical protein
MMDEEDTAFRDAISDFSLEISVAKAMHAPTAPNSETTATRKVTLLVL